ncbi:MAG: hypothetical protein HF314_14060 [Ignavibacteria bacterium]|jgi:hypothetical protein|nr:hypothetical protein [Ignavibacteria bacterium]MCU7504203.1 hypothetical protein [Ignavibacteria bacterium]MCU7518128.1 hypothetical protein [Ignavibacteria bacterium]
MDKKLRIILKIVRAIVEILEIKLDDKRRLSDYRLDELNRIYHSGYHEGNEYNHDDKVK